MSRSRPTHRPLRIAAVGTRDGVTLECLAVFEWDRSYDLPGTGDPKMSSFLKYIGIPGFSVDRWVDVTGRPDIEIGEPFPFQARKEG